MKILLWVAAIIIIALVLKSEYPDMYGQTVQKGIDYGKTQWDERKNEEDLNNAGNQNIVLPDGTVISPESGTSYGMPWDKASFPCKNDEQCQVRFSATSVCIIETGNCIEP